MLKGASLSHAMPGKKPVPPDPVSRHTIYEEISPHTIMTWMSPKQFSDSDNHRIGEDHGDDSAPKKFGLLLHRIMEMEWFDPIKYKVQIDHFLDDLEVEDSDRVGFCEDLEVCLDIYRESELADKLAGLPRADKCPEIPVSAYLQSDARVYKVSGIIDGDRSVLIGITLKTCADGFR